MPRLYLLYKNEKIPRFLFIIFLTILLDAFHSEIFKTFVLLNSVLGLCKFHVSGDSSQCDIGLTKHPSRVAVVLNCTFNQPSVDAVIWTRNVQPIEDNNILKDSKDNKRWSAVVLYTNSSSYQDVGKFTCKAKRGQDVVSSCSVHPCKTLSFVVFNLSKR